MYKVFFDEIEVFNSPSIEDSLAFALSFHKASNKPHCITVYDPIRDDSCISLTLRPKGVSQK